ncbi:MAG TPA: glycerate kinase [Chromatiaceae bacterium]|nr:MAG: glycerate kinase [Thiohalocapsa sp. PB-PSB1]HBG95311.1 glycerate kinase [Chromatiaceae bacterium]HCS90381.1 glycerate kinase [Chromatiaceae bacterium]
MKIILAPNALKGSCMASSAAAAMAAGVVRAVPDAELVQIPVADGGDGLADVVTHALGARPKRFRVAGPRFDPLDAELAWLPDTQTAVIEMALASGLALLAETERDPMRTTTLGTGELMRHALDLGARTLVVGIGGSATNDGGIGMAAALGYRFLDRAGEPVDPVGGHLAQIDRIDAAEVDARLADVRVEAICDVDNPLIGTQGAARVYAPQKGADAQQVALLDTGLAHLADVIARDLGIDTRDLPGAGAAGGLGAGLLAFCGAALRPGADVVLDLVGLERHLAGADLVLTAEGRIDGQTRFGKAPGAVAAHAARLGVPCIAIAGSVGDDADALHPAGMHALFSLCPGPISLEDAQSQSEMLLARTAEQVVRAFLAGKSR